MSRYTYAGHYRNPTEGFFVKQVLTKDGAESFEIWVRNDRNEDGSCDPDRKHTMSNNSFEDYGDAMECIEQMAESFDEDYECYCEENRYDIMRMEQYEAFRNEY